MVLVDSQDSLERVILKMIQEDVNSVWVVNEDDKLVWNIDIVTLMKAIVPDYVGNRDASLAGFVTLEMFHNFIAENKDKKVQDFMLQNSKVLRVDSSAMDAAVTVTEWRQSRIPVLDENDIPVWVITRQSIKLMLWKLLWEDISHI